MNAFFSRDREFHPISPFCENNNNNNENNNEHTTTKTIKKQRERNGVSGT